MPKKFREFFAKIARFHNGCGNMVVNTSEGNCFCYFSNDVVRTYSYGLTTSRNIEIKYPFDFQACFLYLTHFIQVL